ncbi:DsbA family oxidoreductase [Gottfriedia sp. NPDC057991]|uniref:DsbA family oxidoreductase n=1 Tax=Gottfriedia sp. NPDC057991 TaxID=3346298 RepID=UPI0036DC51CC
MKVTIYSDYVCPFCYLGKKPLEDALKEVNDVELEWKPFQLRPEGAEPLSPNSSYIQQGWKFGVQPLAQKLGVEMILPTMDPHPSTKKAHRGFLFAEENGKGAVYAQAVLADFWTEGKEIGDVNVLADIAEKLGLDRSQFIEAVSNTKYDSSIQNPNFINAVPTFIIGDQVLQGVQSKEAFIQALNNQKLVEQSSLSCDIDGNC